MHTLYYHKFDLNLIPGFTSEGTQLDLHLNPLYQLKFSSVSLGKTFLSVLDLCISYHPSSLLYLPLLKLIVKL